jgi:DNA invertase Pin-like site-specific DNA recombinase
MANALVIRRTTQLAKAQRALRAAQYVRMSTELQRYSIQNQAAAIAAYAQQRNLTIVRTYVDEGRSGLTIKRWPGLIELIEDVESGRADFDHILVYDVSRWGRFQDVDESAHHEFVCKRNGVKVTYCAEQFDNDGSLLSSIVKNIKRVMAAEYSRELGVKVHAGHCRIAGLGYRVGGPLTFGLYREMVNDKKRSKGKLAKGECKALKTDRVRLRPGSDEEVAVVRSIFHQFVVERKTNVEIARQLNLASIVNHHGRPWTDIMVQAILKNEIYVGNLVYNRTSRRLGQKLVNNPRQTWIRCTGAVDPIVDLGLFERAQTIMSNRYIVLSEDEMLRRLRLTLARKGKLSDGIIRNTAGLPSTQSYVKHFGSIRKAYALIGYKASRDCAWYDARQHWSDVLAGLAARVAEALKADLGIPVEITDGPSLSLRRRQQLRFQVVRHLATKGGNHAAQWRAHRPKPDDGFFVALRLNASNIEIQDYVLVRVVDCPKYLTLSDGSLARHKAVRVETRGRTDRRDKDEAHIVQPCRASQANAKEQARETRPAQNQERPRAALTDRR